MSCSRPLFAWRVGKGPRTDGTWPITFSKEQGNESEELQLPCGQCIGCRLEKSRVWAVRCVHEASLHEKNCFITLTYSDEKIPTDGSLTRQKGGHLELFFKRLRSRLGPKAFKFFAVGEYGECFQRPHYHACIFGWSPSDVKWCDEIGDIRSPFLERVWKNGIVQVGEVNFESAAYVARYTTKKFTGEKAAKYYNGRVPEYAVMSRRPAISKEWWYKFESDAVGAKSVIVRGVPMRIPRYYEKLLEITDKSTLDYLREERRKANEFRMKNASMQKFHARGVIQKARIQKLKNRRFENGNSQSIGNSGQRLENLYAARFARIRGDCNKIIADGNGRSESATISLPGKIQSSSVGNV